MNQIAIVVAATLVSLAIAFHALSTRFDFVRIGDSGGFRIDRLTGKVSVCGVAPPRIGTAEKGGMGCFAMNEHE